MFSTSLASIVILQLFCKSNAAEPFVIPVFYSDANCSEGSAVSMSISIAGDNALFVGGLDVNGTCSREALCLIDAQSQQCQELNRTATGIANHIISDSGKIQQCDPTNENVGEEECKIIDSQCYPSSLFPHCHFRAYLRSDLLENPDVLKNTNMTDGLDDQGYWVFYKDEGCTQFEAIQGILAGWTTFTTMDDSFSCEDAVLCMLDPEGFACKRLGGGGPNATIYYENRNDGRDVFQCGGGEGSNCEAISSEECMVSPLYPSCHYRWASAKRFFEDPADYIKYSNTSRTPSDHHNVTSAASTIKICTWWNMLFATVVFNFLV